jgi:hypothetical protein
MRYFTGYNADPLKQLHHRVFLRSRWDVTSCPMNLNNWIPVSSSARALPLNSSNLAVDET